MSEENTQQDPSTGERPNGWFAFQEMPVMLQLREPYIGVSYAYSPAMDAEGNARAVPCLSGVLRVEPDGSGGVLLLIQMPTGNSNDYALIAVKPADVLYCTHLHQARIVTQ